MDSILFSRNTKNQTPNKLLNLSPEKYGKAAFGELTYTPSKLADNVLYRQVTTMKKAQEGSSKLRQFQAMNGFMKQRLIQMQLERDGIESSLNQQISMYKKMLYQTQIKHESRLKEIQLRFSNQINYLILQKEEEIKFSQAQKQVLQSKIEQLQRQLQEALDQCNEIDGNYKNLENQNANLNGIIQKYKIMEKEKANEQEVAKRKQQQAKRKLHQTQQTHAQQIQNLQLQRAKQKQALEKLMKIQLEKAQCLRMNQNFQKGQELRQVMIAFEVETKRLSEIIVMKDRTVQAMTTQNMQNKENNLRNSHNYELKLQSQYKDYDILSSTIDQLRQHINQLESELQTQITNRKAEKQHFNGHIIQLKQQLQYNHINNVRQRDQFEYWGTDLQKQCIRLKNQNMKLGDISRENERLSVELVRLRDLLMQSSYQIDRSKEQLTRILIERDKLALKTQRVLQQQDRLYLQKRSFDQFALKGSFAMKNDRVLQQHERLNLLSRPLEVSNWKGNPIQSHRDRGCYRCY